jgi:hypothetical protein
MPGNRVPQFTAWMYPLLGDDDRENFTRAVASSCLGSSSLVPPAQPPSDQ